MNDSARREPGGSVADGSTGARSWASGRRLSALAAATVVVLALGSVLWPGDHPSGFRGVCLVFDPGGGAARQTSLLRPLNDFLGEISDQPLKLVVVRETDEFLRQAAEGADYVICPDGLGLRLDADAYVPLAAGRRTAPRNLRPRCVMVYRQSAGRSEAPWIEHPGRTVFGDSVSLSATGVLRTGHGGSADGLPSGCSAGPDPYDHAPVLHALRLGGFDYAVVRQWDAERFFTEKLLPGDQWSMEILTGPVPDLTLFASREIPAARLLDVGGELTQLGRSGSGAPENRRRLARGLAGIHLSGFNLLVEPDLDLVRGGFPANWPPAAE